MADASPEHAVRTPSQRNDGVLVSPQSIYRKRMVRGSAAQTQRVRTSASPMSSRGHRHHLRYANQEQSPIKIETLRHASPFYSGKWDLTLSMIEEKRSPIRKRFSRRFQTVVDEGLLTVKGMAPSVCLSTFSPLLLSSVIMRKNLAPPRITAYSSMTKRASHAPSAHSSAGPKRYSTASPQKRRTARPKTSHIDWDSPSQSKAEETFDDVTAWD